MIISRSILNRKASTVYSSSIAMELLKGEKHNIGLETTLITDGGETLSNEVYSKPKTEARKERILQNKTKVCCEN